MRREPQASLRRSGDECHVHSVTLVASRLSHKNNTRTATYHGSPAGFGTIENTTHSVTVLKYRLHDEDGKENLYTKIPEYGIPARQRKMALDLYTAVNTSLTPRTGNYHISVKLEADIIF
jgi:hypothetical protein